MFDLPLLYTISFVSQATSALVLALVAWTDRRSRWLIPLASACALHAAAIFLNPRWRGTGRWLPQAMSAAVLPLMLYLIHHGLRSLIHPLHKRSLRSALLLAAGMLLFFPLAHATSIGCIETASASAAIMLSSTAWMLWNANTPGLRGSLRSAACLLFVIAVQFLIRMPIEVWAPKSALLLFLRGSTLLFVTSMAFAFLAIYVAESHRRLHEESRKDVLTGLPNRRAIEETAARQVTLSLRQNQPCALLMIDLDNFKKLNDTWGHDVGDQALLATGSLLLRTADGIKTCQVARIGGEEFTVLLPNWGVGAAHSLARWLCGAIAAIPINAGTTNIHFTASVGVSVLQAGETTWSNMLRRADVALYRAKREGRNRVSLCTEAQTDSASMPHDLTVFAGYG